MPPISPVQLQHIAKLARLRLKEGEAEKYAKDLGSILTYVDILKSVDTTGVEPTAQVPLRQAPAQGPSLRGRGQGHAADRTNALRDDALFPSAAAPDALLATSPLPLRSHQIETPAAHG